MSPQSAPLLAQLREQREARKYASAPATPAVKSFDFTRLPDFEQLKLQRAASEILDINMPYYRTGDAVSPGRITVAGQEKLQFASYDYLGLNQDPRIANAIEETVREFGVSATASRLAGGQRPPHLALEKRLASVYDAEEAISFVSGHATNVTTIGCLTQAKDLLLVDALCHNSIYEGARLSGATRLTFPHNDWQWVDRKLAELRGQYRNVLIAVEGLYSMDGDLPDLARFIEVKSRHTAWLMVDDAHGLGVAGKTGLGVAEHCDVDPKAVDIWMGTLSKSLCSCGGYIAGSQALCDYLRYKAGGLVYSVGLPPAIAAAADRALELMQAEPERVTRLQSNAALFLEKAGNAGLDCGASAGLAIIPVIIGDSIRCVLAADRLGKRGINVIPVIPPGVPEKMARLRFFVTASHSEADIVTTVDQTAEVLHEVQALDLQKILAG